LHERAANSEHFVWAEDKPGAEMYRRMSVQSENSVYEWTEMFKNGCKSVKHQGGARAATEGNSVHMVCLIPKLFILRA